MTPGTASEPAAKGMHSPDDQLPGLLAEFPCFRIWRERTCDRVRYIARSLHPGLNPHTIVTDDIAELRDALKPSRYAACPRPHATGKQASAPPARPLSAPAP
jgi:hypothetical protein